MLWMVIMNSNRQDGTLRDCNENRWFRFLERLTRAIPGIRVVSKVLQRLSYIFSSLSRFIACDSASNGTPTRNLKRYECIQSNLSHQSRSSAMMIKSFSEKDTPAAKARGMTRHIAIGTVWTVWTSPRSGLRVTNASQWKPPPPINIIQPRKTMLLKYWKSIRLLFSIARRTNFKSFHQNRRNRKIEKCRRRLSH